LKLWLLRLAPLVTALFRTGLSPGIVAVAVMARDATAPAGIAVHLVTMLALAAVDVGRVAAEAKRTAITTAAAITLLTATLQLTAATSELAHARITNGRKTVAMVVPANTSAGSVVVAVSIARAAVDVQADVART